MRYKSTEIEIYDLKSRTLTLWCHHCGVIIVLSSFVHRFAISPFKQGKHAEERVMTKEPVICRNHESNKANM